MSDLAKIFTLPLAKGNYPFKLSAEEERLSGDDWAWLFLRLNPLYRHDYALYKDRKSEQWRKLMKEHRPGALLFPPQPVSHPPQVIVKGNAPVRIVPTLADQIPDDFAELDSRYFCVSKMPLSGKLVGLRYLPISLREYVQKANDPSLLSKLTLTDFEAPRSYGIATWVDPDLAPLSSRSTSSINIKPGRRTGSARDRISLEDETTAWALESQPRGKVNQEMSNGIVLEPLPPDCSWFYLGHEPLWQANTWALRQPKLRFIELDGEEIAVGTHGLFEISEKVMLIYKNQERVNESISLEKGQPIPTIPSRRPSTELNFLVCLDGYVKPQIDLIRPIAQALKALHKGYYKKAVARGTSPDYVPVIFNPDDEVKPIGCSTMSAYVSMRRDSNFLQKHWRQVRIDVSAPLVSLFETVTHELETEQNNLAKTLAIQIRKNVGDKPLFGDHWLKRALCVLELTQFGLAQRAGQQYSPLMMGDALYDNSAPLYWEIRGDDVLAEQTRQAALKKTKEKRAGLPTTNPDKFRKALRYGRQLVLGYYEFIATKNFKVKPSVSRSIQSGLKMEHTP